MATVYLAHAVGESGFTKQVAIKVLHPHLADDEHFNAMFLDEMRITSRLTHPNICQVLDFGRDESDAPYLVMEFLDGAAISELQNRSEDRRLTLDFAARIVAEAARGLEAAHAANDEQGRPLHIVHRDVSPQNLMALVDGSVKVLDFGIARAQGRASMTRSGQVKGKVAYMPPEQLRGEHVEREADIWALGVVLWEVIVGFQPFAGNSVGEIVANVMSAPLRRPSDFVANCPPALDNVVMSALCRDPSARIASAAALADRLEKFLFSRGRPFGAAQVAGEVQRILSSDLIAAAPTQPKVRLPSEPPGKSKPKLGSPEQTWRPADRAIRVTEEASSPELEVIGETSFPKPNASGGGFDHKATTPMAQRPTPARWQSVTESGSTPAVEPEVGSELGLATAVEDNASREDLGGPGGSRVGADRSSRHLQLRTRRQAAATFLVSGVLAFTVALAIYSSGSSVHGTSKLAVPKPPAAHSAHSAQGAATPPLEVGDDVAQEAVGGEPPNSNGTGAAQTVPHTSDLTSNTAASPAEAAQAEAAQAETAQAETAQAETAQAETAQADSAALAEALEPERRAANHESTLQQESDGNSEANATTQRARTQNMTRARTVRGRGFINLVSHPASKVWVDGRLAGRTPRRIEVSAGTHQVVFESDEGVRRRRRVSVGAGESIGSVVHF